MRPIKKFPRSTKAEVVVPADFQPFAQVALNAHISTPLGVQGVVKSRTALFKTEKSPKFYSAIEEYKARKILKFSK